MPGQDITAVLEPGLSFQQGFKRSPTMLNAVSSIRTAATAADSVAAQPATRFCHETIDQHARNGAPGPAQVFPGLMFGASFRLPKARPEK